MSTLLAFGVMGPEQLNCNNLSLKLMNSGVLQPWMEPLKYVRVWAWSVMSLSKDPKYIPTTI